MEMTVQEKIAALRAAAKANGGDGVLLLCSDPHASEYLPAHHESLAWASGFHGENAFLVVTQEESALWCDGRYYVQADRELAGTGIRCMHDGAPGVPKLTEYLTAHFAAGEVLLVDGSCVPAARARAWGQALAKSGAALRSADVVSPLWAGERPPLPDTPCRLLAPEQTGYTAAEKLAQIRADLKAAGATALAVPELDCVAWLCNLRAADLPCTPLAVAYAFVTLDACTLFLAPGRLKDADAETLAAQGIALRGYGELMDFVRGYAADETVLASPEVLNYDLFTALQENPHFIVKEGADPITARKGVKNAVELKNIRECHIRDGVAMVRFQMDLEAALAAGAPLREADIEAMLQKRRREQPGCFDDSFAAIAAYGPNAAMMHYHAVPGADSPIGRRGFLLVDCGGQYDCGTTDITRTYPVGPLTDEERRFYTWVLQCHIDMARAVFLDYCTGFALDSFARAPLWSHRINYRCGTGHGVGYIASVHEGPQSLRPQNGVVFKPGMTVTDEPGVYETDRVGIRIENELECVHLEDNQYGTWLGFRPLTLVPISLEPVLADELSRAQLDWLNAYHQTVYEALSPRLTVAECAWLRQKTAPLAR